MLNAKGWYCLIADQVHSERRWTRPHEPTQLFGRRFRVFKQLNCSV